MFNILPPSTLCMAVHIIMHTPYTYLHENVHMGTRAYRCVCRHAYRQVYRHVDRVVCRHEDLVGGVVVATLGRI